ncbi:MULTISPECIES: SH3 domain-containing protein [unclassified Pseudocitrobacter]|uniref:SH3 domain-containing protein n=1 Tax=unclassified Pseudocitrobacter TaxID=2638778 RepID=UPI0023E40EAD|nr:MULTISPECIES: SH3 domain-containing protein [unclassified Pseudocitrobacter]MDF3829810.1 SH3 domain-containing protein [Pseudocitrobacter sp. 2023EL-00150]MEC5375485.1 SH3 domain-containing protein [Pseudocitrobacter sp. MW920760]
MASGSAFSAQIQKLSANETVKTINRLSRQASSILSTTLNGSLIVEQMKIANRFRSFALENTFARQTALMSSTKVIASLSAVNTQVELVRSLQHHTFAELLNSRSSAVEQILQRRYSGLNTHESIGELLARRYGLSIDEDGDTSADNSTLPELPQELLQLPIDQALAKTNVQIWLSKLSGYAKKAINAMLIQWLLITIIGGVGNDAVKDVVKCYLPEAIVGECSSRQTRKEIQNILSTENRWENLKNFRLVTRDNVFLRAGPSERAEILEMLPMNTLLLIMDKSNRQWLAVEIEYNGEIIQGWVSRRYTLPLHRH